MESSELRAHPRTGRGPRHAVLESAARRELVTVLEELGSASAPALAARMGLHVTTVRFHLERLVAAGMVTSQIAAEHGVGRPPLLYSVTPGSTAGEQEHAAGEVSDHDRHLLSLTDVLIAGFREASAGRRVSPEEAGAQWSKVHARDLIGISESDRDRARTAGQWMAKIGRMVDLLQAWGYRPRLDGYDGGGTVEIRLLDCPFLELARADPDVVCGIHTGLIRGALAQFGEPDAEVDLEPFTEPPLCRARILTRNSLGAHTKGDDD